MLVDERIYTRTGQVPEMSVDKMSADYLPKAAKGIAWRGRWRRLVGPCVTRKCCEIPTQPKGGHRRSKLAVVLALICEPGRALIGQSGGARVPARQIDAQLSLKFSCKTCGDVVDLRSVQISRSATDSAAEVEAG